MARKKATPRPRDDLSDGRAVTLFNETYEDFKRLYGKVTSTALHMINDLAMLEQLKQQYRLAIGENVMLKWQNGENQGGEREHPLLLKIHQATEQQRRLLSELKLTPASRKAPMPAEEKTGGDDFETF